MATETYKVVNGTSYDKNTPDEVIKILEEARKNRTRVRLFFGDVKTGKDWMEQYDIMGVISRSCGTIKIPILLRNSRSLGGIGILDYCIVKITEDKQVLYKHPNYFLPELTIKDNSEDKSDKYPFKVMGDGVEYSQLETMKMAQRKIAFFKGELNRI